MTTRTDSLEDLARRAVRGDRDALDRLVRSLQGDVYGLSLRLLWNREDAEDATQEILVRVVTRLAQFDFRSRLRTWVYRVAVNYLLDVKKSPVERMRMNFDRFADDLGTAYRPMVRPSGAIASHRRSEDRLHARHASMPRSTASASLHPRRDPRAVWT